MELRHFRYFVASRGAQFCARRTAACASRSQPCPSRSATWRRAGVTLFQRLPRGSGSRRRRGVLADAPARSTAGRSAMTSAQLARAERPLRPRGSRTASSRSTPANIEDLLAGISRRPPEAQVHGRARSDADTITPCERTGPTSGRLHRPMARRGFDALRIVDCTTKGVLLPANHPLAPSVDHLGRPANSRGCTPRPSGGPASSDDRRGAARPRLVRCGAGSARKRHPPPTCRLPRRSLSLASEESRPGTGPRRRHRLSPDYRAPIPAGSRSSGSQRAAARTRLVEVARTFPGAAPPSMS